ncbi:protein chibby homolog 1 [Aethina tumida]|uniref:protein chibby homolog 1 n=1 Tax=Aethina tumida TaxID=116153 RepID=UPI00096B629F|nr:protein chibby homolog 1 [Aethina tumida]
MQFFSSKFSPKKTPLRKNTSCIPNETLEPLVTETGKVLLSLDNQELVFKNGDWKLESGDNGTIHKTNQKLAKRVQELNEENNLLRLKYETVLNMLTQTTAESHLQEKELERLRKGIKHKG